MPSPEPDIFETVRSAWNASAPERQWIVEQDPESVIVMDDTDRSLYRVPVLVGDDITFGTPVPVKPAYLPANHELVAASRTVFASREESRPDVPPSDGSPPQVDVPAPAEADQPPPTETPAPVEQPAPDGGPKSPAAEPEQPTTEPEGDHVSDLSDIARGLGLPEGATKEQILAAISAKGTEPEQPDTTEPTPPAEPADEPEQPAEPQPSREQELVAAMADMKAQIARLSQEVAASKAEKAATIRASVIDDAIRQGKVAPSERSEWERRYDRAPDVATEILASIAPGTAVPVMASGVTGPAEPQVDDDAAFAAMVAALDAPTTTKGV